MNSKTFCILPWAHTRITTDGTVTPCCKINSDFSNQNINTLENFDDWWNNDRMRDLRKDLGSGIKNQNCAVCWADEAAGKSSLRQEYNKRLGKHTNLKKITKSTTYINEQVSLEKTNGNWVDLSDTVTTRVWADQESAEAWAAFISQTATDNGTTCSVVITDI